MTASRPGRNREGETRAGVAHVETATVGAAGAEGRPPPCTGGFTTMLSSRGHRPAAALAALALAGALALTGCSAGADSKADGGPAAADRGAAAPREGAAAPGAPTAGPAAPGAAGAPGGQPPVAVRPHVIRTATLAVETERPQQALAAARTAAEGAGGYVGDESTERGKDGRLTSTLTLRVPGERFDAVIGSLEGGGKLLRRKVEALDVTEKVADVDSRVTSQRASVVRVREMMDRASALADVVMLEGELSRRQADLESLQAQQNALKDQTALGTIALSVVEPAARAERADAPGFSDALGSGWRVFTALVRYLVLAVAAVLPFALAAALVVVAHRLHRRLRPAKPRTGPAAPPVAAGRAAAGGAGAGPAEEG